MNDTGVPDTETPDTGTPDTAKQPASGTPTVAATLKALQALDTAADQLRVRRQRLAERDRLAIATRQLTEWEQRRAALRTRLDELTSAIEQAEAEGATTLADRKRLEAQLRTVIAPREAEALMHEIETINVRRNELDDAELSALEEQAALDDNLTQHLGAEQSLRDELVAADETLSSACGDIDSELSMLDSQRADVAAGLDPAVLSRYETVRASSGVAVSELRGPQCTGCHLSLSAAEIDTAKDEAAGRGYTDCPQCGRLLVIGP